MVESAHFPVLDISEFWERPESGNQLLYHEVAGYRRIEKPHKHDFFLFMLFESGNGTHRIDFTDHPVQEKQIHLLFPGQIHTWKLNEDTLAHQLMIGLQLFDLLAHSLRFPLVLYKNQPVIHLSESAFKALIYEFKTLQSELSNPIILWELVSSRLKTIALMISREAESSFQQGTVINTHPILLKYLSLIDSHFCYENSVGFYASQLNISANYLNILCKRYWSVAATSLIHDRSLLEAKRLLLTTNQPVKAIAFDLGFYDVAYFSRFFKKNIGMTPVEFKKGLLNS